MKEIRFFYNEYLGFEPYNYQVGAAESLLSGRNIILSVPTGAGKTWGAIIPYLYTKKNGITNFPQKLIYSLPLRTLANSIYQDVENLVEKIFNNKISLQTGEDNNDIYFEKDIIFSTIDQTLSNFLCFPLPLSKSQANINAGSLIGSYLIFDEFHLLDPELSMATTLGTLMILGITCRYCIMTATLSNKMINKLCENLPNLEVISLDKFNNDIHRIKSLIKNPEKKYKKELIIKENEKLTADAILDAHKTNTRTIVICNRVETAQKLFTEVNKKKNNETIVICIHSRFFNKDRKIKEAQIKKLFGKDASGDAILISTQVIEAGMDISCDVMHTEISPINSFLQRAGRCARFESEYGIIYVYDILDLDEKDKIPLESNKLEDKKEIIALNNKYLPYNKELCNATLKNLKKYKYLDTKISDELVNNILSQKEDSFFKQIEINQFNKNKIHDAWKDCSKGHYRKTVRNIQNIEVVIIDEDEKEIIEQNPFNYESIGVYRWSLTSWIKEKIEVAQQNDEHCAWIVEENTIVDFVNASNFCLKPVTEVKSLVIADIVFVNKKYFFYDPSIGLNFLYGNFKSPLKEEKINEKNITLKKDTYYQHCNALIKYYERELSPNLSFAKTMLINLLKENNIEIGDIDQLIILMLIFHDYGKLNDEWQTPIRAYQREKSMHNDRYNFNPNEILAHTDFDRNNKEDLELAKRFKLNNKPPHAGIGGIVIKEFLINNYELPEQVPDILCNAITKHHSVETEKYKDFNIKENDSDILKLLEEYSIHKFNFIKTRKRKGIIDNNIINDYEYLLYFFFVRILRIADQKATENYQKYIL